MVALLPAALPHSVVYNKTPDPFIIDHLQELQPATALLSNDLGAASALSWRLQRPDVTLYNTIGEVKYGLAYPDAGHHQVDLTQVQQWMNDALDWNTASAYAFLLLILCTLFVTVAMVLFRVKLSDIAK